MPLFTTTQPLSLMPGESLNLFNNESPAAGAASQAVALPASAGGGPAVLSFSIAYAAAPTATLTVQASDSDADASFVATPQVSTNKQYDRVELTTGAAFARVQMTSVTAGEPVTVICHRGA